MDLQVMIENGLEALKALKQRPARRSPQDNRAVVSGLLTALTDARADGYGFHSIASILRDRHGIRISPRTLKLHYKALIEEARAAEPEQKASQIEKEAQPEPEQVSSDEEGDEYGFIVKDEYELTNIKGDETLTVFFKGIVGDKYLFDRVRHDGSVKDKVLSKAAMKYYRIRRI